jgi:uncharacterized protein (DUF433 family)
MKQTKITIILNQPLTDDFKQFTAKIILSDPQAFGGYPSFSEERVTVEEIDDTSAEPSALDRAEARYPCKELSDKLARGEELTPQQTAILFRNMDKQMAFFGGYREREKTLTTVTEEPQKVYQCFVYGIKDYNRRALGGYPGKNRDDAATNAFNDMQKHITDDDINVSVLRDRAKYVAWEPKKEDKLNG